MIFSWGFLLNYWRDDTQNWGKVYCRVPARRVSNKPSGQRQDTGPWIHWSVHRWTRPTGEPPTCGANQETIPSEPPKRIWCVLSRASEAGSPTNRPGSDKTRGQGSFDLSTGGPDLYKNLKKKRTAHLIRLFY